MNRTAGLLLPLLLFGCSKGAPPGSLAAMLCDKEWMPVAATATPAIDLNGDGRANSDLIGSGEIGECLLESSERYNTDGSYGAGTEGCGTGEERGQWRFDRDSMALLVTAEGKVEQRATIQEMSDTRLILAREVKQRGTTYAVVTTYSDK